jgi:hypothetical protein
MKVAAQPSASSLFEQVGDTGEIISVAASADALGSQFASRLIEAIKVLTRTPLDRQQAADLANPRTHALPRQRFRRPGLPGSFKGSNTRNMCWHLGAIEQLALAQAHVLSQSH